MPNEDNPIHPQTDAFDANWCNNSMLSGNIPTIIWSHSYRLSA